MAERKEVAEQAARIVLEAGGTFGEAAEAADVSVQSISNWVRRWEEEGWRRPDPRLPAGSQTGDATEAGARGGSRRWVNYREQVGFNAGMTAAAMIRRAADLLPGVGVWDEVVDVEMVAGDGGGQVPSGRPVTRRFPRQQALDVERLARGAERLFLVAERAAGLMEGEQGSTGDGEDRSPEAARARLLRLVRDTKAG